MSLTAPAIHAFGIESSVFALWEEFLGDWFDGARHSTGPGEERLFPSAHLRFQQSRLPQPMNGIGITACWITHTRTRTAWDQIGGARQQRAYDRAAWLFLIRAEGTQADGNPARACANAAELLHGVLRSAVLTGALGEKGIHHIRCSPPQLLSQGSGSAGGASSLDYAMRHLTVNAELRYPILSQIHTATPTITLTGTSGSDNQYTLAGATGAAIYYTTNGTTPTAASTLYSAPFLTPAVNTVKAVAILAGQSSLIATRTP